MSNFRQKKAPKSDTLPPGACGKEIMGNPRVSGMLTPKKSHINPGRTFDRTQYT